jgi:general secretion pathway protein A
MLRRYFGFHEDPFGATPDPRFLYQSHTHREALASLQYGFHSNRGFTALIAPPGMGKTTLLFRFLDDIRKSARSVFLFETQCEPRELIGYILRDLGITPGRDCVEMHEQLNGVLVAEARAGRKFVVVIDEAQNLSDAALETVRLLTNFETSQAKLMQIVLAGQPQLSDKLMNASLEQLRQRISTICRLEAFSKKETIDYIHHRLKLAGYSGEPLLTADALNLIAEASQGIPRMVNNLCFNALSLCRALKRKQVDGGIVAEVIADQQLIPQFSAREGAPGPSCAPKQGREVARPTRFWFPAAAVLLVASVLGLLGLARSHKTGEVHSSDLRVLPAAFVAPATAKITNTDSVPDPSPKTMPLEITVEPHQTLQSIIVQHLGKFDDNCMHQIQTLNPHLVNPNMIQVGQKIRIPAPTSPSDENVTQQASVRNLP